MPEVVVLQYVPDAVMNERVNIGVIVVDRGRAKSLFLKHWQRIKQFAGRDVTFLKEIERDARTWDESTVRRLSASWTGSVQLTEPRHTLLPFDQALYDAGRRFLFERTAEDQGYRGKSDAVRMIRSRIREKLVQKLGTAGRALIRDSSYELKGENLAYEFDVSVGNGQPYFSAQGLSFEVPNTRRLDKEIASTAWLIEDVKRLNPHFPIGVAALPPQAPRDAQPENAVLYRAASTLFSKLGATVVEEDTFASWADEMVNDLPKDLSRRRR